MNNEQKGDEIHNHVNGWTYSTEVRDDVQLAVEVLMDDVLVERWLEVCDCAVSV